MELLARGELDWWWTLGKALRQAVSYTQDQPDEHAAVQRFRMQLWRAFLTSTQTPATAVEVLEALQEYDQPLMPYLIAWSDMDTPEAAHHLRELIESCVGPSWLDSPFNPELGQWIATGRPAVILTRTLATGGDNPFGQALDTLNTYSEQLSKQGGSR